MTSDYDVEVVNIFQKSKKPITVVFDVQTFHLYCYCFLFILRLSIFDANPRF